ncbi:MAG: NAD(+)/NADH kinase, partial [Oscillospiraceae bacterium]|nr:NAD(+)/NADH kinase [Oscillospiraceae bacterium]
TNEYVMIDPKEIPEGCECIITIGGDGTLLHAVKGLNQVPIIQYNKNADFAIINTD